MSHKKLTVALSLFCLLGSQSMPVFAADPQVSGDWSVDDPTATPPKDTSSAATAAAAATGSSSTSTESAAVAVPDSLFKKEAAVAEPVKETSVSPTHQGQIHHDAVAKPAEKPLTASATTTKLFGRIEQIQGQGASFPVFKAMTPTMDTTGTQAPLKGQTQTSALYSGVVAKSFPEDFRGNWGGSLQVWRLEQAPVCFRIDPVEAGKVQKIFKKGAVGQVNFQFANNTSGGIYLAPAQMMFQESGADADLGGQMAKMLGGQSMASMGPMGQMMQQMAASMPVPVVFSLGGLSTSAMAKGLSGNDFVQRTLRNVTRQLSPTVIEQQVLAEQNETMKATGQPRKRYEEAVLRFTKVNAQQMYVQVAQMVYGGNKSFEQKIIMYGYVTKGVTANTNPYSGIMQMPGMSGGQLPAGLFGGGGAGGNSGLQLPPGLNLQNLFGQ